MTTLGAKIRRVRMERGLTQTELGGKHLTKGFISQLEHDKVHPSFETLTYLAKRLRAPVEFLLENETPNYPSVYMLFNNLESLIKDAHFEEAIDYEKRVISQVMLKGSSLDVLRFRMQVGKALFKLSRYVESLELFQELYDTASQIKSLVITVEALYWMANCYFKLEEFNRAAAFYKRVVERCSSSKLWNDLYNLSRMYYASCCVRTDDVSEALSMYYDVYNDAIKSKHLKLCVESGLGFAWTLHLSGRTQEALNISQDVEKKSKEIDGYWSEKIRHNKAIYLQHLGNISETNYIWRSLLKSNTFCTRDYVLMLEEIAADYYRKREYDIAKRMILQALHVLPDGPYSYIKGSLYVLLGHIHKETGDIEVAKSWFQLASQCSTRVRSVNR